MLSQEDKKQISNSKSFTDVKSVMDPHWNWSSHRLLLIIIQKLKSWKSLELLQEFDRKINKQMKLKTVHEKLEPKTTQSSSYCKMIAVLDCQKDYSEITLEKGLEIEEFVFDFLGPTGAHLSKAHNSTTETQYAFIEMEWSVSIAAVDALCAEALKHKDEFAKKSFLSLKIGDFAVFNEVCNYIGSYFKKSDIIFACNQCSLYYVCYDLINQDIHGVLVAKKPKMPKPVTPLCYLCGHYQNSS